MPVNLYYTQEVWGFQQENVNFFQKSAEICFKSNNQAAETQNSHLSLLSFYEAKAVLRTMKK